MLLRGIGGRCFSALKFSCIAAAPASATDAAATETGATAWLLVASALVLFMTLPGLALFHGGPVRESNLLAS
jgi:ammonium transporter, Amt family